MEHTTTLPRPLDPGTFGSGRLVENLTAMLNEQNDRHLARRVLSTVNDYKHTVKHLRAITDTEVYEQTMRVMREKKLTTVREMNAPLVVRTHLANFLVTVYRNEFTARGIVVKRPPAEKAQA